MPITDKICKKILNSEKEKAIKFQGKPVNICALKYSEIAKTLEKRNIEEKFKFKCGPMNNIGIAINKLKNNGISIKANGIRILKLSSKVSEFTIQDIPLK